MYAACQNRTSLQDSTCLTPREVTRVTNEQTTLQWLAEQVYYTADVPAHRPNSSAAYKAFEAQVYYKTAKVMFAEGDRIVANGRRFDSKPTLFHDCCCHKMAHRATNALQGCSNTHMHSGVTLTSRAVTLNGQDACPMCWEPLACGPTIMLTCGHACHLACAKEHLKQVPANCFQRYNSINQFNVHLLSLELMMEVNKQELGNQCTPYMIPGGWNCKTASYAKVSG